MHSACSARALRNIASLLEHGCKVDVKDSRHRTPLMIILREREILADHAKLLLDYGADLEACDDHGTMQISLAFSLTTFQGIRP